MGVREALATGLPYRYAYTTVGLCALNQVDP
jgi:hypothetical protein